MGWNELSKDPTITMYGTSLLSQVNPKLVLRIYANMQQMNTGIHRISFSHNDSSVNNDSSGSSVIVARSDWAISDLRSCFLLVRCKLRDRKFNSHIMRYETRLLYLRSEMWYEIQSVIWFVSVGVTRPCGLLWLRLLFSGVIWCLRYSRLGM